MCLRALLPGVTQAMHRVYNLSVVAAQGRRSTESERKTLDGQWPVG